MFATRRLPMGSIAGALALAGLLSPWSGSTSVDGAPLGEITLPVAVWADSSSVHRFLLGSVAERVTRAAPCPVMIVPHHMLRGTKGPAAATGVASATQS